MARSSKQDVLDKFRFEVQVIQLDFSISAAIEAAGTIFNNAISQKLGTNPFTVLSRAGFNEIVLPKADINIISYRENIDNNRFSKSPGLVKYDPVILKRGISLKSSPFSIQIGNATRVNTSLNQDLYNWYQMVNNDTLLMNAAQELTGQHASIPSYDYNFRREVLISAQDRDGNSTKQWMLFNAFPIGYKGGNDLSAQAEEKLIEELTLTYEFFLEFEGGLAGLAKEIAKNAIGAGTSALIGSIF